MESFITLFALVLLVTAAAVITGVAIYNRKRRQPTQPKVLDETQPTAIAEKYVAPREPQPPVVEEAEPAVAEETPLTSVAETQLTGIHEAHLPAMVKTQPTAVEEAQSTKAQEAQPTWATIQETQETVPAETRPTIIAKEIQNSRAGETQAIAIQAIAAEETEPRITEWPQPPRAEKGQPEGAEEAVVEVKRGQREPIKRGGKPRGLSQDRENERTQGIQPRRPNPKIVCWKRERQWVVAVEVAEELLEKPGLTVLQNQNGSPLPQDESEGACWRLEQVFGEVIVRWNEAEAVHEAKVDLGQDNYLLFRLIGQNLNQGCRVKSPSFGSYLVIAPNDWKREEALSGPPPIAPEPVCLEGYQAHFFDLEKGDDQKIAFQLPNGQPRVIEAKAPRFELIGSRLGDASEYMGPLFGEGPPRIRALDTQPWENVKIIVVGEEGSGRGRWRTAFQPDLEKREQDLPLELANRKGGWYFLRFYDNDDNLIESMDFRFLSALKEIRVPQSSPLPTQDGHKPVRVELAHEADCAVKQVRNVTNIQVQRQDDKTVLIVPPDPACDESWWVVGLARGPQVEITIHVERIWWAVEGESNSPSHWQDRPIILARKDFRATSSKSLWLRLPKRRWVDKVLIGFEQSRARPYDARVTEKTVAIPLREYGDYNEIGNETQEHSLRVWIERDHKIIEGVLAAIPASHIMQSWVGLGRKKAAIAKAVMQNGSGEIKINGRPVDDYFRETPRKAKRFLERLLDLREVREALSQMEVIITVEGSNPTTMRQPKAVAHALARALMDYDPRLTPLLRQAGLGGVEVKASKVHRRGKR